MALFAGQDTDLYVDTADVADPVGGAPTWVLLPNQRGASKNLSRSSVNANTKQNNGWTTEVTISRSWSIPFDGFADEDDAAYLFIHDTKLHHATATDVTVNIQLRNAAGDTYTGISTPTDFSEEFSSEGLVEYSGTFNGRGAPTVVRA